MAQKADRKWVLLKPIAIELDESANEMDGLGVSFVMRRKRA